MHASQSGGGSGLPPLTCSVGGRLLPPPARAPAHERGGPARLPAHPRAQIPAVRRRARTRSRARLPPGAYPRRFTRERAAGPSSPGPPPRRCACSPRAEPSERSPGTKTRDARAQVTDAGLFAFRVCRPVPTRPSGASHAGAIARGQFLIVALVLTIARFGGAACTAAERKVAVQRQIACSPGLTGHFLSTIPSPWSPRRASSNAMPPNRPPDAPSCGRGLGDSERRAVRGPAEPSAPFALDPAVPSPSTGGSSFRLPRVTCRLARVDEKTDLSGEGRTIWSEQRDFGPFRDERSRVETWATRSPSSGCAPPFATSTRTGRAPYASCSTRTPKRSLGSRTISTQAGPPAPAHRLRGSPSTPEVLSHGEVSSPVPHPKALRDVTTRPQATRECGATAFR